MEILAYGEDALTLWAMKYKVYEILKQMGDKSKISDCKIFYRPSFGRSGGINSSQFGEFDFIITSKNNVYLGESKWIGSSEIINETIQLRGEQLLRHKIFSCYLECWLKNKCSSWNELSQKLRTDFDDKGISKPIAPIDSLLASNIQTILEIMKQHFQSLPEIKNVLLYFYKTKNKLPHEVNKNFKLILIDYSDVTVGNLIKIEL